MRWRGRWDLAAPCCCAATERSSWAKMLKRASRPRIWLEENAKKQLWASILGTPRVFTEEVARRVHASLWERKILLKTWDHYVAKGQREGIL